jgi:uncharacterized membrane protein
MRPSQIAVLVALAVGVLQIAYYYPLLPAVVGGHFNAAGVANSWQPKQVFFGIFVFVYLLIALSYLLLPRFITVLPAALINLPNKDYWLAPERQAQTARLVADQMAWFGAAVIIMIVLVGQLAIQANLPGSSGRLSSLVWLPLVAFALFTLLWGVRFLSLFRR